MAELDLLEDGARLRIVQRGARVGQRVAQRAQRQVGLLRKEQAVGIVGPAIW